MRSCIVTTHKIWGSYIFIRLLNPRESITRASILSGHDVQETYFIIWSTVSISGVLNDGLTNPLVPVPVTLRARPRAILPFHPIRGRTNDHARWVPVLDPVHDAQHHAMVRLVFPVGTSTIDRTLTDPPRARSSDTVTHAGYHEKSVERVHLISNPSRFGCITKRKVVIRKTIRSILRDPRPVPLGKGKSLQESETAPERRS